MNPRPRQRQEPSDVVDWHTFCYVYEDDRGFNPLQGGWLRRIQPVWRNDLRAFKEAVKDGNEYAGIIMAHYAEWKLTN